MSTQPIGVFDSGLGGLTVLKVLAEKFPQENFLYLGDTARLPYGNKSPNTIRKYAEQNMNYLIQQNVKAIVVACNSASSQIPEKEWREVPVYNVIEPGAKKAVEVSTNKKIGVLGTRATINSDVYPIHIHSLDKSAEVYVQACPLFVPLAEEGWSDDPITNLVAYRYLQPMINTGVDTLVLGCTHYPILKNAIQKVMGNGVTLVDSGETIAENLAIDFAAKKIKTTAGHAAPGQSREIKIALTDYSDHTRALAKTLIYPLDAQFG